MTEPALQGPEKHSDGEIGDAGDQVGDRWQARNCDNTVRLPQRDRVRDAGGHGEAR